MYKVIAYNRYSLAGQREFFFKDYDKAREKRVDLLVTLPEEYVVEIREEE